MRVVLVLAVLVLILAAWVAWTPHRERSGASVEIVAATPHAMESFDDARVELGNPHEGAAPARLAEGTSDVRGLDFLVVDDATGAAIERFALRLAHEGGDGAALQLEFHARGRVRRTPLQDDRVKVCALGYRTAVVPVHADPNTSDTQTIRLRRAGGIHGVVHLAGAPVAGAIVYQQRDDGATALTSPSKYAAEVAALSRWWNAFAVDRTGAFEIPDARTGFHALRFEASGAASEIRRGVRVNDESVLDIGVVDLEREAIVNGVLVPPLDVSPIAFALELDGAPQPTRIAADGTFQFRGLARGSHAIGWRRTDNHDAAVDPANRRVEFELVAGETREVVIDATGSGTFDLTVRVSLDGKPAPHYEVRATPRRFSVPRSTVWSGRGTTDANGVALLRMKPGETVYVEVLDSSLHTIGRGAQPIEMTAATAVECAIELAFGTIAVDLPWELVRSEQAKPAMVAIELWDAAPNKLSYVATTDPSPADQATSPKWTGQRIDFGAFQVGEYRVHLTFGSQLPGPAKPAENHVEWKQLREEFHTRIVVQPHTQTLIVVP